MKLVGHQETYLYELDVDMLSVFLAVLAVYLWKTRKFGFLWGALPLIGTLGIYQCNISVSVVLILFTLVLALVQGKMDTAAAFRKGLLSLAMLALGSGLYLLIYGKYVIHRGDLPWHITVKRSLYYVTYVVESYAFLKEAAATGTYGEYEMAMPGYKEYR